MINRRAFVGLLVASTISLLGSRMTAVALPWLVLVTTGSASKTGIVAAAELVPYVLACALIGPAVDRLGSRRMSILGDLASAVVVSAVPVLHGLGDLNFLGLVGLVIVVGITRGLGDTSKRGAIFPEAVAQSGIEMTRATSLSDGISRAASMIGALLAGGLIVWMHGPANVLLIDAASFVACAVLVGVLVRPPKLVRAHESAPEHERYWPALQAGLRYIRTDTLLLGLVLMLFVTNMLDQAYATVLVPLWARDIFGSPVGIGLVAASFGAGAVLGNIVYTVLAPRLPRWAPYTYGFLIAGAPRFFVLGFGGRAWLVIAIGFLNGMAIAAVNPILDAVLIERIPLNMQARISGIGTACAFAGMPLGALLGGWLGGYGARVALLVVGGVYLVATLAPLFGRFWREMDARPVPAMSVAAA